MEKEKKITSLERTNKMWAFEWGNVNPDIVCISKSIIPMWKHFVNEFMFIKSLNILKTLLYKGSETFRKVIEEVK